MTVGLRFNAGVSVSIDDLLDDAERVREFCKSKDLIGLLTKTEEVCTHEVLRCCLGYVYILLCTNLHTF